MKSSEKQLNALLLAGAAAAIPTGDQAAAQGASVNAAQPNAVSIEGGWIFSNVSSLFPGGAVPFIPQDFGKTGLPPVSQGDIAAKRLEGGYGAVSYTKYVDAQTDWRTTLAGYFLSSQQNTSSNQVFTFEGDPFSNASAAIFSSDALQFQTFDFDLGKKWTAGPAEFRAFAGFRAMHAHEKTTTSLTTEDFFSFDETITQHWSRFYGAGPRVGVDAIVGTKYGFLGSISTAVVGGWRDSQFNVVSLSSGFSGYSNSGFDWIGNVSGTIGVFWMLTPDSQLTVGYKVDRWFNLRDSFTVAGTAVQRTIDTEIPFARLTVRF